MTLAFRTAGDPQNPALVFVHGFLGNAEDWSHRLFLCLNGSFSVFLLICLDMEIVRLLVQVRCLTTAVSRSTLR